MKCWLCDLDDLNPGEGRINEFGDCECIYCTDRTEFTVKLLTNPELIPLVRGINELPRVDGVSIGLRIEEEEE